MKETESTSPPPDITDSLIATIKKMPLDRQAELLKDLCRPAQTAAESQEEGAEKRQYPRKSLLMPVDYTAFDHCYKDFIRDISAGGVFIETSRPFAAGQKISMTFMSADNQHHFKIDGKIVRTLQEGIGIEFNDTGSEQSQKIGDFLSKA